jgi:osmotically-inducible protein OsmY
MNRTTLRLSTLALAAAALTLAACGRDDNRTAGQKLDAAVAKTEQATDQAKVDMQKNADEAKATMKQEGAELKANAKSAADRATAAVADTTAKAGTAIENAADKLGDKAADAGITASVNAELAKDPSLSALKINVDTNNGRVLLRGTAPSPVARDRATTLAKGIKGVTGVDNQLEVRG